MSSSLLLCGRCGVAGRSSKQTLLVLLVVCADVDAFSLGTSSSLLEQCVAGVGENAQLSLLDALQPVTERGADAAEERVCPESVALEDGAHFNAELPDADGNACETL